MCEFKKDRLNHLHRHGPQVGTKEKEPHQLVGLYGYQIVNLPQSHFPHRHAGGGQVQDFVVNHCLVKQRRKNKTPC